VCPIPCGHGRLAARRLVPAFLIKRLLAKYGYPPDAQPGATELMLRQMETFAEEWSPEAGGWRAGQERLK
jgi:hypothetical protein